MMDAFEAHQNDGEVTEAPEWRACRRPARPLVPDRGKTQFNSVCRWIEADLLAQFWGRLRGTERRKGRRVAPGETPRQVKENKTPRGVRLLQKNGTPSFFFLVFVVKKSS
jgi:hypothetical protein